MAEMTESLIGEVNHVVKVTDVARHAVRVKPLGAKPLHRPLQRGLIDVGEHDACSAAGELGGGGQADAARTAEIGRASCRERVCMLV